jgi:hypothetical protein
MAALLMGLGKPREAEEIRTLVGRPGVIGCAGIKKTQPRVLLE